MDYIDLLRPIFSLAAHAVASDGVSPMDASRRTVHEKIEAILATAGSRGRHAATDAFNAAGLAICAWLDETFPDGNKYVERHFPGTDPDREFFGRLDLLLGISGCDKFEPERQQALEVFAGCLQLGYRGRYRTEPDNTDPQAYLDCCRREMSVVLGVTPARSAISETPLMDSPADWVAMLPFWFIPIAVTLAVYAFYSRLLSDLCAAALG